MVVYQTMKKNVLENKQERGLTPSEASWPATQWKYSLGTHSQKYLALLGSDYTLI